MRTYTRRRFAQLTVAAGSALAVGKYARAQQPGPGARRLPPAALEHFAGEVERILREHRVVGASLAIAHAGDVVLERAYGLADLQSGRPVTPATLFSLASVSKPFTAVGILALVGQGRLDLNARVVDVLNDLGPLPGQQIADPRFRQITVHQLLYHGGGLIHDAPSSSTPRGEPFDREDIVGRYRALLSRPLLFEPGTQSKYSNAGFMILELVCERVAGESYEPFIQEAIFQPLGITHMRREHGENYLPEETRRYHANHRPAPRLVGNWLATPRAIVRFASAVAGSGGRPTFLAPEITQRMFAKPASLHIDRPHHVGLGWDSVRNFPDGRRRFSKNGGKPGVQSWLEHLECGVDWGVLLNTDNLERQGTKPIGQIRKAALAMFERTLGLEAE